MWCKYEALNQRCYSTAAENFKGILQKQLEDIKAGGTFKTERVITSKQESKISVEGIPKKVLNFCANNYLGLSANEEIKNHARKMLEEFGGEVEILWKIFKIKICVNIFRRFIFSSIHLWNSINPQRTRRKNLKIPRSRRHNSLRIMLWRKRWNFWSRSNSWRCNFLRRIEPRKYNWRNKIMQSEKRALFASEYG